MMATHRAEVDMSRSLVEERQVDTDSKSEVIPAVDGRRGHPVTERASAGRRAGGAGLGHVDIFTDET